MFDFAWSEIALIGVVALIAIGPKDLPVAIKSVAELVKKARKMAGEFQTHVDEMVKEANLSEVRDQFNDLRRMDIKGKILSAVDGDNTIRNTIAQNPFEFNTTDVNPAPPPVPVHDAPVVSGDPVPLDETIVAERPEHAIGALAEAEPPEAGPPAFIPPRDAAAGLPSKRPRPPAFVPPAVVVASAARSAYASPYA
jgi:sec-independent protein translocase protein TatB